MSHVTFAWCVDLTSSQRAFSQFYHHTTLCGLQLSRKVWASASVTFRSSWSNSYLFYTLTWTANRTLNFKINTPDNVTIGAWFALSDPYYRSLPSIPTDPAEHVIPALKHSPATLFLHGNAATRAFGTGIEHIKSFSFRLGANVLIIDYRGFGDSSGTPSEDGLVTDAKAAFDWLISHGKKAEDILIIGHSLGTGVSGQLGAHFAEEGIVCKGIVFLAVSNPGGNYYQRSSHVCTSHSPALHEYWKTTPCLVPSHSSFLAFVVRSLP